MLQRYFLYNYRLKIVKLRLNFGVFVSDIAEQLVETTEPDQRLTLLLQLADSQIFSNPQQSIVYAKEAASIAEQHPSQSLALARAWRLQAGANVMLSEYEIAVQFAFAAEQICMTHNDLGLLRECINVRGLARLEQGKLAEALQLFESALDIAERDNNRAGQGSALHNIAIIYKEFADHERALEFNLRNLELQRELGNTRLVVLSLNSVGLALLEEAETNTDFAEQQKLLEQSHQYFTEALELHDPNDLQIKAALHNNIGSVYLTWQQPQRALDFFATQLEITRRLGNARGIAGSIADTARAKMQLGHIDEALLQFQEAQTMFEHLDLKDELFKLHRDYSTALEQAGQIALAFEHFKQFHALESVVKSQSAQQHVHAISARFDLEKAQMETEIQRLRSEELEMLVQQRTSEVAATQFEMLERLASAVELRDFTTGKHVRRVSEYSAAVAARLGVSSHEVHLLRSAAQLHDIGKIGIADSILQKPGQLSASEWEIMKTHTEIGAMMLADSQLPVLQMAREIAISHHERFDGTGYPFGLTAQAIPLMGRIVAIVDVFDALISSRPYKAAWTREAAIAEIQQSSGSHFDPMVVKAFIEVLHSESVDMQVT